MADKIQQVRELLGAPYPELRPFLASRFARRRGRMPELFEVLGDLLGHSRNLPLTARRDVILGRLADAVTAYHTNWEYRPWLWEFGLVGSTRWPAVRSALQRTASLRGELAELDRIAATLRAGWYDPALLLVAESLLAIWSERPRASVPWGSLAMGVPFRPVPPGGSWEAAGVAPPCARPDGTWRPIFRVRGDGGRQARAVGVCADR